MTPAWVGLARGVSVTRRPCLSYAVKAVGGAGAWGAALLGGGAEGWELKESESSPDIDEEEAGAGAAEGVEEAPPKRDMMSA